MDRAHLVFWHIIIAKVHNLALVGRAYVKAHDASEK